MRTQIVPSRTASVRGPAKSKFDRVVPLPLQAAIHSLWWPMDRGNDLGGRLYSRMRFSGIKRGLLPPQPSTSILPLSPTKQDAVLAVQLPAVFQFLGTRRQQPAVVPVQLDWGHARRGRGTRNARSRPGAASRRRPRSSWRRRTPARRASARRRRGRCCESPCRPGRRSRNPTSPASGKGHRPDGRAAKAPGRATGPSRARRARAAAPWAARCLAPSTAAACRCASADRTRRAPRAPGRSRRPRATRLISRLPSKAMPWFPICVATLCSRRGLGQGTGLVDRAGERLLAVDVLSPLDGRHRDDRVRMVRRAHDDRVDPLLLVEHLAEVLVFLGPRILVERVRGVVPIDVGQGHDVLAR